MQSSTIRRIEDEFEAVNRSLSRKILKIPNYRGDEKQEHIEIAKRQLEEMVKLEQDLEFELARSNPETNLQYHDVLERMKKAMGEQEQSLQKTAQEDLFGVPSTRPRDIHREKLLEANEHHIAIDHHITNTKRVLAETEEIGIGVGSRLRQQREQLIHAQDELDDTDDTLVRTRKLLSRMGRRVMTDKLIQSGIIGIEIIIICVIIYLKFGGGKH